MSHVEARTAIVSLFEYQCVHNFYNIDNTCNIIEGFVQFTELHGILQLCNSTLIQIPFGNYTASELISTLNDCFIRDSQPKQVGSNSVYILVLVRQPTMALWKISDLLWQGNKFHKQPIQVCESTFR